MNSIEFHYKGARFVAHEEGRGPAVLFLHGFLENRNMWSETIASLPKTFRKICLDLPGHGCTIGQLDEDAMFYLKSRGIPEKEAKALLLYAFANDGLRNVKIPALRKKLNRQIAKKLNVNLDFEL